MIINWHFYFIRNLPHGLFTADTDVCLFVKDLDKKSREFEVSEEHFSDMLLEKGVNCVRKVITSIEVYISGVWLSVIISALSTSDKFCKEMDKCHRFNRTISQNVGSQWWESWHGKSFKNWLRLDCLPHGTHAKIGSSLINMCWWNLYIVYHSNYSLFYCCMWISRFKIILIQINLFQ